MNFLEVLKVAEETERTFRRATWYPHKGDLCWSPSDMVYGSQCIWARTGAPYTCTREDMFADDWELTPLPPKPMSFMEAVECMKQGRRVRRPTWPPYRGSMSIIASSFAYHSDPPYAGPGLTPIDVESNDWVLVEEPMSSTEAGELTEQGYHVRSRVLIDESDDRQS